MFCAYCGKELSEGTEFCGNCGTKTTGALQIEQESKPAEEVKYLISYNYRESGPYNFDQIKEMIKQYKITRDYHICKVSTNDWKSILTIPEFKAIFDARDKASNAKFITISIILVLGVIFGSIYLIDHLVSPLVAKGIDVVKDAVDDKIRDVVTDTINKNNTQQNQRSTTTQQSQQPTTTQKPNTTSNTETLTYYVNGDKKTANVVYVGLQQMRYSYDAGRNVIRESSFQEPGGNWSEWIQEEIIKNPSAYSIYVILTASFNFFSAAEITNNNNRIILIFQKNDPDDWPEEDQFIKKDGDYFYTLQKVYVQQ